MGYKLSFAYDNRGNLTDVVDRDNGTTHYVYDDDSRMTSVTNPFNETTGYEYSPGGWVDKRLLANGCVTYYGYDEAGQVSLVDNRHADLSVISSFAYERDARGNPTRITREDGSVVEYGYDAKSQLTSEVHKDPLGATTDAWEWNYDLSGNRLYQIHNDVQTDYTYNLANQLLTETTDGVTTYYKYDRCGNTVKKQAPEGTTSYRWNHENRLTQIDQPGNVHSYFSYDADGKRVTKQDADGFTQFIYQGPDMLKLLQERDADGNVTAHYTMGDGLESMHRGVDSRFYHYDWLGSTFELTDDTGLVTDSYLYDAWGNALAATGATPNPHRYVGRPRYYEMAGTGLYHVGHRQLSPKAGRFVSQDTLLRKPNPYNYVLGCATHYVDPNGLAPMAPLMTINKDRNMPPLLVPIKSAVDWLNAHPSPKGSPERLAVIEELIYEIVYLARPFLPVASRSLRRWMGGQGDTAIDFGRLLHDSPFRSAYNAEGAELVSKCCGLTSISAKRRPGSFTNLDLKFAFHDWDKLDATAKSRRTGRPCWVGNMKGDETLAEVAFSFSDRYDWSSDEATRLPLWVAAVKIPQAWFLEYKESAIHQNRPNRFGGPPGNFVTRSRRDELWRLCCVAGNGHLVEKSVLQQGEAAGGRSR